MKLRNPAVAGSFYEADGNRLRQDIASLMTSAPTPPPCSPQALIVPHAGYVYSGSTAAAAYQAVQSLAGAIERVVLFGPAHRVSLQGMALPGVEAFETPLGQIPLDTKSIQRASAMSGVCISDEAHRQEHSLEVQLPFLQTVLGDFALVPVVVGYCDAQTVASVVDALWGGPETLRVVSTDLSHFHTYDDAVRHDTRTCERLCKKDNALRGDDACGAYALNGLMSSDHCRSLQVDLLSLCNSGDTAGNRDRVVGYGAFLLH